MKLRILILISGIILIALLMSSIRWHWWHGFIWRIEVGKQCTPEHLRPFVNEYCSYDFMIGISSHIGQKPCIAAMYQINGRSAMRVICL